MDKMQTFVEMASKTAGRNLVEFFEKWGLPVSQETETAVNNFEKLNQPIWDNLLNNERVVETLLPQRVLTPSEGTFSSPNNDVPSSGPGGGIKVFDENCNLLGTDPGTDPDTETPGGCSANGDPCNNNLGGGSSSNNLDNNNLGGAGGDNNSGLGGGKQSNSTGQQDVIFDDLPDQTMTTVSDNESFLATTGANVAILFMFGLFFAIGGFLLHKRKLNIRYRK